MTSHATPESMMSKAKLSDAGNALEKYTLHPLVEDNDIAENFEALDRDQKTEALYDSKSFQKWLGILNRTFCELLDIPPERIFRRLAAKGYWSEPKQIEFLSALWIETDDEEITHAQATKLVKGTYKTANSWLKSYPEDFKEYLVLVSVPAFNFTQRRALLESVDNASIRKAFIKSSPDIVMFRMINNKLSIVDAKVLQTWEAFETEFGAAATDLEQSKSAMLFNEMLFSEGTPVDMAYAIFLGGVESSLNARDGLITEELALDFACLAASWFSHTGASLDLLSTLYGFNPKLKRPASYEVQKFMRDRIIEDEWYTFLALERQRTLTSGEDLSVARACLERFVVTQDRQAVIDLLSTMPQLGVKEDIRPVSEYLDRAAWVEPFLRYANEDESTICYAMLWASQWAIEERPSDEAIYAAASRLGITERVPSLIKAMTAQDRARNEIPLALNDLFTAIQQYASQDQADNEKMVFDYVKYQADLAVLEEHVKSAMEAADYAQVVERSQAVVSHQNNPPLPLVEALKGFIPTDEEAETLTTIVEGWIDRVKPAHRVEAEEESLFDSLSDEIDTQKMRIAELELEAKTLKSELDQARDNLKAVGSVTLKSQQRDALLAPELISLLLKDDLSLCDTLTIVQQAFPKVVVLESAYEAAEASPFAYPKRVLSQLIRLAGEFRDQIAAGKPSKEAAAMAGLNGTYRPQESDSVLKDERLRSQREFVYQGCKTVFKQHLSIGTSHDPKETCQIHFLLDEETLVIGRLGSHLDTSRSK